MNAGYILNGVRISANDNGWVSKGVKSKALLQWRAFFYGFYEYTCMVVVILISLRGSGHIPLNVTLFVRSPFDHTQDKFYLLTCSFLPSPFIIQYILFSCCYNTVYMMLEENKTVFYKKSENLKLNSVAYMNCHPCCPCIRLFNSI